MTGRIVLASGSVIRAKILTDAGVDFTIVKPDVDEDVIKRNATAAGLSLEETAARLADAKALAASVEDADIVIGSDQIMEYDGRAYDKPKTLTEAAERLNAIAGSAHTLINAVSVARAGRVVWRNLCRPTLHMRSLTAAEISAYIEDAGPVILTSVGAYQVERLGSRLFERIDGDYFAVLGLSLYPTLGILREFGALDY
ncbi:MAG: Maf family protein [Pseudomonadota bacterium]